MVQINQSLKDEYARYCANSHMMEMSYELWLEGRVNFLALELADAKRAIHLPDSYRARLEKLVSAIEPLRDALTLRDVIAITGSVSDSQMLLDQLDAEIAETYKELGGLDEDMKP